MTRSLVARTFILVALAGTGCARAGGRVDPQFSAEPRLEATIEALGAEVMKLRAELDSLATDLRAHNELVRAMRLELQRLKEIDLKPRPRPVP